MKCSGVLAHLDSGSVLSRNMHQKVFDLNILQGAVTDNCKVGGEACSKQPKKWMLIGFRSAF